MPREKPSSRLKAVLMMSAIIGGIFAFAAVMTLAAPSYSLALQRHSDGSVDTVVSQKILLVFPWRTQTMTGVTSVSTDVYRPEPTTNLNSNSRDYPTIQPDEIGTLHLKSNTGEVPVMVTPEQLPQVAKEIRDFLNGLEPALQQNVVANWTVAVVVPTIFMTFGGLLILGTCWDLVAVMVRFLTRRGS